MRFIKENSYDIVKFFIYQIGIAVFSLAVAIPLNTAITDVYASKLTQLGVSVLAIIFYCILVYTVSWEQGATDRIKIDGGRMTPTPTKGLKIALLANVPNFIISAVATVASFLFADGNVWTSVLAIALTILGLFESMYLGAVEFIVYGIDNASMLFYLIKSAAFLLLPFITVIAAHVGYTLGDKNKRIFGFITDKKKTGSNK